jgi:hypothetical protein
MYIPFAISWLSMTDVLNGFKPAHLSPDTGLRTGALGDIIYCSNATGPVWSRLTIGAANTVLVGGGTTPAWSNAPTLAGLGIGGTPASGVKLLVNANAAAPPEPPAVFDVFAHFAASDGNYGGLMIDTFYNSAAAGESPTFIGRSANGTAASPSAVEANKALVGFGAMGYGSTGYSSVSRGQFGVFTSQAWTDANQGTRIDVYTTPNNSTTLTHRVRFDGNVYFPGLGTTASAANAFLDSSTTPTERLMRSTSRLAVKRNVRTITDVGAALDALRPFTYESEILTDDQAREWYGFAAEEVAAVDPRLVNYGYLPEDWLLDAQGHQVLKPGAVLVPDGVQYDRLTVLLVAKIQRLRRENAEIARRVNALEAR